MMFMLGSVLWEISRSHVERARLVRVTLQEPERTPQLIQQAAELARRDPDVYFAEGLQVILYGIEGPPERVAWGAMKPIQSFSAAARISS